MLTTKENLTLAAIEAYKEQAEKDIALRINDFERELGIEVSSVWISMIKDDLGNKTIKLGLNI